MRLEASVTWRCNVWVCPIVAAESESNNLVTAADLGILIQHRMLLFPCLGCLQNIGIESGGYRHLFFFGTCVVEAVGPTVVSFTSLAGSSICSSSSSSSFSLGCGWTVEDMVLVDNVKIRFSSVGWSTKISTSWSCLTASHASSCHWCWSIDRHMASFNSSCISSSNSSSKSSSTSIKLSYWTISSRSAYNVGYLLFCRDAMPVLNTNVTPSMDPPWNTLTSLSYLIQASAIASQHHKHPFLLRFSCRALLHSRMMTLSEKIKQIIGWSGKDWDPRDAFQHCQGGFVEFQWNKKLVVVEDCVVVPDTAETGGLLMIPSTIVLR